MNIYNTSSDLRTIWTSRFAKDCKKASLHYMNFWWTYTCLYGILSAYALILDMEIFCSSSAGEIPQQRLGTVIVGRSFLKCLVFIMVCFHWKHWNIHNDEFAESGILSSRKSHGNGVSNHLKFCGTLWKLPLQFQLTCNWAEIIFQYLKGVPEV